MKNTLIALLVTVLLSAFLLPDTGDELRSLAVASWNMDEASGVRYDSARSNDLADIGGVGYVAGKIGNAAYFDGIDDLLYIASNADVSVGNGDFTITTWVYLDEVQSAGSNPTIFNKAADGYGDEYWITAPVSGGGDEQYPYFIGGIQAGEWSYPNVAAGNYTDGQWYFITFWRDGGSIYIQVNNGTIYDLPIVDGNPVTEDGLYFGGYGAWCCFLHGAIDETNIFKTALTQEQRDYLWNDGNGRTLYP